MSPPAPTHPIAPEFLLDLVDHAQEMMQSLSPSGQVLWVNRAWLATLGYTAEEARALTVQDFIAPESKAHCLEAMGKVMAGQELGRIEAVFLTRDGRKLRVEGSARAKLEQGQCIATLGIFRPMHPGLQRDHDLRHFFDLSLDLLCIANQDGYFTLLNPAWKSCLGYELEELIGRPFMDFVHPDDLGATREALEALIRGEEVVGFENRYLHRDGGYRHILWTSAPDPHTELLYAAARDVTELRQAQAAVEDREARQRALLEASVDGIMGLDARGAIEMANPAAARIFGCEVPELSGSDLLELLSERDRAALAEQLAEFRSGGTPETFGRAAHVTGVRSDGSSVPLELTLSEVPAGDERHLMATLRDLSERQAVERLKKEFVSTVSHELRTPLTSIRGSLRLLAEGAVGGLPPEGVELVGVAHANCMRLADLIDDILDLEKLDAGQMELRVAPIDVAALVRASVERMQGFASEHQVELRIAELPEVELDGDSGRIEQVLANLLSNAVKFSPEGGQVEVRVRLVSDRVRFEVRDEGPGIRREDRARIFDRFQQVDATDRRPRGGTGLGLAICRALVEAHRGSIAVAEPPGGGSLFWFELPRHQG